MRGFEFFAFGSRKANGEPDAEHGRMSVANQALTMLAKSMQGTLIATPAKVEITMILKNCLAAVG